MTVSAQPTATRDERFVLIDALRAFAALWVVAHHWYFRNLVAEGSTPFVQPIDSFFREGWLGVEVFFVLSGFVITHSIRGAHITPSYVGRFALRRSLRLDPPYWVAIAGIIVLNFLSAAITHERLEPPPSGASIVAHLFYLQGFFGFRHIVGVFWTLCYEIQFYLILVTATGVAARFKNGRLFVFVPLWFFCIATAMNWIPLPQAFCFSRWPLFFLGVIVHWAFVEKSWPRWVVPVFAIGMVLPIATLNDWKWDLEVLVAALTAGLIALAAWRGWLTTVSMGPVVQFYGRISYSVYLLHMVIGTRALHLAMRHFGYQLVPWQSVLALLFSLAVTTFACYVNYRLVEKPAHGLSRRVSMTKGEPIFRPRPEIKPENVSSPA